MLQEKIVEQSAAAGPMSPAASRGDDRVDLKELVQVLRRRRSAIFWTTALLVLAAFAYTLVTTPLYTASTQILIDPRDRNIVHNDVNPASLASDGGVAIVESQLLVITSDSVLRRAIARERLASDPEFDGTGGTLPARLLRRVLALAGLDAEASDRSAPELKALRELKRRIGVKRSDKAFVVDIYVATDDRDKSVRLADAIAQSYLTDQAESRAQAARQASGALTARLEELRTRVRDAETRVEQYRAQNNIVGANGVLVSEQQLTEINNQLNTARARTMEARARVEQIERLRRAGVEAGATPEAVQSQTIGMMRAQYAEAARQLADLAARVGPRHPSIATAEAQVRDLRRLINDELTRIAAAARSDLERAQAGEQSLERSLDALKKESIATRQAFVRLRELEREVEAGRAVYEAFLVRARETGEQQMVDTTNARIISSATPPRDKSWPPRSLILAIALVVGLGGGTGVGLLREYFDDRLHSRRQLQSLTGAPVLATLPELPARTRRLNMASVTIDDVFRDSGSKAAIAFTTAIGRVRDALRDFAAPRRGHSVLIASADAGDGKTTVALHLARAAAAAGERVLLIDADFDRRIASKLMNAGSRGGLADLLEGRTILSAVVVTDDKTGINLVPVGHVSRAETRRPAPADVLARVIEPARTFDLVIIDGGSLLSDACVRPLADAVDDIVFVARAGSTRDEDVAMAIEGLRANAAKIRGSVLNATPDGAA